MKLVWLVPSERMFEKDWIEHLFQSIDHTTFDDHEHECIYFDAILVFNHSMDYEKYLAEYGEERVPYGAIHLSDETLGDTCDYLQDASCVFAFRNYFHPVFSKHPKVTTIGLGYKAGFASIPASLHAHPWYHWCFAGALHDRRRLEAIQAFQALVPYFVATSAGGFNENALSLSQYRNMLETSKFALCPVGQGNLDTFRLYEAMEAGCVPVVLARQPVQHYVPSYWHHMFDQPSDVRLPFVVADTWDACADQVRQLLQDPREFEDLRKRMNAFWAAMKDTWKSKVRYKVFTLESFSR